MQVSNVQALSAGSIVTNEPPPASSETIALEAVAALFRALNQQGIRYCQWKSTLRLEQGLRGQTDLDVLVDRKHSETFRQLLGEHHLKPVLPAPGRHYPGIESYLGFDRASGKLFHLHVHYQLVLGEQFVKNYRLPVESYVLDWTELRHEVKIPIPELEAIILAIRALLKYRDRDAFKDIFSIRSAGLPAHILNEIDRLLGLSSQERLAELLAELADVLPTGIVKEFFDTVTSAPRAGRVFLRLRHEVRQALRVYQRYNRRQAMLKYFQEAWRRRKRFRFSAVQKMTLPTGGVTLALIGADGAGKSTMRRLLAQWLTWKLDVSIYYLGSKEPSRRSTLLYTLFRAARRGHRAITRIVGENSPIARPMEAARQLFLYTHYLSIGWDRYGRYRAGKRRAMAGSIILFDRYPLDAIAHGLKQRLMDGPQIRLVSGENLGRMGQAMARAEQALYRKIFPPDHLLVLVVTPDISMQRKPDHDRAAIEAKSQTIGELMAIAGSNARKFDLIPIDANRPAEEVLSQLKARIWEVL